MLGALAGVAAAACVSVASYALVFRHFRGRSLVAPLIASIGLAFFLRSLLTFFVGFDQQSFQVPLVRSMRFGGVRILPTDLWLAGLSAATLAAVLAVLFATPGRPPHARRCRQPRTRPRQWRSAPAPS